MDFDVSTLLRRTARSMEKAVVAMTFSSMPVGSSRWQWFGLSFGIGINGREGLRVMFKSG